MDSKHRSADEQRPPRPWRPRLRSNALVIFPGALGDFVCFLPTLLALRELHEGVTVVANPSLLDSLALPRLRALSIDRREIADLFGAGELAPATCTLLGGHARTYTWSGWGNETFVARLAMATGGTVQRFQFRGMRSGEHAVDYYARCVGVIAAPIERRVWRTDEKWLAVLRAKYELAGRSYLVVHPGSGGVAKNWTGFTALVECWKQLQDDAIVVVCGPAELERGGVLPAGLVVETPTLPQLAALLCGARLYVGNDSGVSHLAAAVGARGVVLFGASDPLTWAPRGGGLKVVHATSTCLTCCVETFCTHRLPVETVVEALALRRLAAD